MADELFRLGCVVNPGCPNIVKIFWSLLAAICFIIPLSMWYFAPPTYNITELIKKETVGDTVLENKMLAIYAGESEHQNQYDVGDKSTSFGPFQLHYPGLAELFQKETNLDPRKQETVPEQVKWVAKYLREHPNLNIHSIWHGYYHGLKRLQKGQAPTGGLDGN